MSTHSPDRTAVKTLLDAEGLERTLSRIAHEIIERNDDLGRLALVGIHTRGVPIAERLAALIEERSGEEIELGAVDITFHRDDAVAGREQPVVHATTLDFELGGMTVILVDDVLYTGRTIRAAIETLFERGRPARVQLAVIVDRGHRELPIRPDYVGKNLPTARSERIQVELGAVDITFHRDDAVAGREQPVVHATALDFELRGMTVILVDDVLYTGRTIRAAIETLFERGRPARVQLAVLVDRGHRELPIRPDYVGKNLPTARSERIQVELAETDGGDRILLVGTPEEKS